MTRPLISGLAAVLFLVVAGIGTSSGASAAEDAHIDFANFYFCDPSFENNVCQTTIAVGDTVVWENIDGGHTVTQCDDTFSSCPPSGGFESGFLSPGDTFSQTFDTPATVSYWCALHPVQMRGRIIVEAQETPTPSPTTVPTAEPGDDTPTPSPAITPADVPSTGGAPSGNGGSSLPILIAALGIVIASTSVLTLVRTRRR